MLKKTDDQVIEKRHEAPEPVTLKEDELDAVVGAEVEDKPLAAESIPMFHGRFTGKVCQSKASA